MRNEPDHLESELINRVADGDRAAFKRLFDQHFPYVSRLALRLLGNRDDAAEVTQDVFYSLWKGAARLRKEARLATWLHRVTVNRAINSRTRGGILSQIKQVFSLSAENDSLVEQLPASPEDRPDRQHEIARARVELADLLAQIPERQREAYLLHKLDGLTYQEVAQQLDLTVTAVESLIHRAKTNLNKAMLKSRRAAQEK